MSLAMPLSLTLNRLMEVRIMMKTFHELEEVRATSAVDLNLISFAKQKTFGLKLVKSAYRTR